MMKKYIIINKYTNNNQLGGSKNIIILSYNVYWKAMLSDQLKICNKNKKNSCNHNIISNITNTIKKYKPNILGFQEAAAYTDILKVLDSKLYDYFVNKSGLEQMLTCWLKNTFTLQYSFSYEFEDGRPFAILILKHNITEKLICVINIHSGHELNSQIHIFDIINNFIKDNIDKKLETEIDRVIMFGDFNRNTFIDDTSDYVVVVRNKKFILVRHDYKDNTCCSINNSFFSKNYDFVLDSKYKVKRYLINKEKYYMIPSSDHIMIIGKLE